MTTCPLHNVECPGFVPDDVIEQDQVSKINKDLLVVARQMSAKQARFVVDAYYIAQENRMRDDAQIRSLAQSGEPTGVIEWFAKQSRVMENQMKKALDVFSASHRAGEWARSNLGVGPVLAAGLLAYIDIDVAETASNIWSYAGLNPMQKWNKGEKRPWNASLKVLTWKLGQSFMKVSNNENSVYGQIYRKRKAYEIERNNSGANSEEAARILKEKKFRDGTTTKAWLEKGVLSPGHIDARARRYAVKIFLSHFHQVWRSIEGKPVREPYPIAHLGHAHTLKLDPKWLQPSQ